MKRCTAAFRETERSSETAKFFYSTVCPPIQKEYLKCQLAVFLAVWLIRFLFAWYVFIDWFRRLYSLKALKCHRRSFIVKEKIKCELKNKLKLLRNCCQKHISYIRVLDIVYWKDIHHAVCEMGREQQPKTTGGDARHRTRTNYTKYNRAIRICLNALPEPSKTYAITVRFVVAVSCLPSFERKKYDLFIMFGIYINTSCR